MSRRLRRRLVLLLLACNWIIGNFVAASGFSCANLGPAAIAFSQLADRGSTKRNRSNAAAFKITGPGATSIVPGPGHAAEPHEKFRGAFGGEFGPNDRGLFM
jgi:hypothetical protein